MIVEILKWSEYNPRKDYRHPRWFALSNRFLEDPQFFEFSSDEKLAWIYILSQASQKNSGKVEISTKHASRVCGISEKTLKSAISKLNSMGCTESVQATNGICTESVLYNTEQNNTEQNNTSIAQAEAFADFYKGYPRKIGKDKALKAYRRELKAGASSEDLLAAREKFKAHHEKLGTEAAYIPYPATFLSGWKDWLDPETGSSSQSNFEPLVKKLQEGFRKFPAGFQGGQPLIDFVGEENFKLACKVDGGIPRLRTIRTDEKSVRLMIGLLKEAHEKEAEAS